MVVNKLYLQSPKQDKIHDGYLIFLFHFQSIYNSMSVFCDNKMHYSTQIINSIYVNIAWNFSILFSRNLMHFCIIIPQFQKARVYNYNYYTGKAVDSLSHFTTFLYRASFTFRHSSELHWRGQRLLSTLPI